MTGLSHLQRCDRGHRFDFYFFFGAADFFLAIALAGFFAAAFFTAFLAAAFFTALVTAGSVGAVGPAAPFELTIYVSFSMVSEIGVPALQFALILSRTSLIKSFGGPGSDRYLS